MSVPSLSGTASEPDRLCEHVAAVANPRGVPSFRSARRPRTSARDPDRIGRRQHRLAVLGTAAVYGLFVLAAYVGMTAWHGPVPPRTESVVSIVFLEPSAPPTPVEQEIAPEPTPEATRAVAEPQPREPVREPVPVREQALQIEPLPLSPDGLVSVSEAATAQPSEHAMIDSVAAALPSPSAPPAPQLAGRMDDCWEAQVMARLADFRRYPGAARARGEQGIAVVRMRMDRAGRVLSTVLERSSGSSRLDAAALETFHRAQPLPRIPDSMPDEVEIAVPVDFFMR